MDHIDVMEKLDALFAMVSEAWGVPLGNDKCIIEREKALKLITEIKAALPTSISEAKRLVAARDEFIGSAKREAEAMRKSAEEKARILVDEQEISRIARAKSMEMISDAENKAADIRRIAGEYVDKLMRQSEETLSAALNDVREKRSSFRGVQEARRPAPSNPKEL